MSPLCGERSFPREPDDIPRYHGVVMISHYVGDLAVFREQFTDFTDAEVRLRSVSDNVPTTNHTINWSTTDIRRNRPHGLCISMNI